MIMSALDFCRALNERNKFFKYLFKLIVGKYAYKEYELLKWNLKKVGYDPELEYGLEKSSYHKKSIKQIVEESNRYP